MRGLDGMSIRTSFQMLMYLCEYLWLTQVVMAGLRTRCAPFNNILVDTHGCIEFMVDVWSQQPRELISSLTLTTTEPRLVLPLWSLSLGSFGSPARPS